MVSRIENASFELMKKQKIKRINSNAIGM